MRIEIVQTVGPDKEYYGIAHQCYLPGDSNGGILSHITGVLSEIYLSPMEYSGPHFYLANLKGKNNSVFNQIDVLIRVESEPSIFLPTKKLFGIKYHKVPHHELEILTYSKSGIVLNKAVIDYLKLREKLLPKSKRFPDEESEIIQKAAMKKRLDDFCEDVHASREIEPLKIFRRTIQPYAA